MHLVELLDVVLLELAGHVGVVHEAQVGLVVVLAVEE